ncbi:hypothetical protein CCY99_05530 [Helicobacter sp. 16-1353]|uniref:hypothetical protein n=1 Tax=Helicobacter sp. 16-1353 TaxID=2004996 RepID=UPI000DCC6A28|nr:hypothetical protein [Helicobacter sp. 16-1353]RAX53842.1 hypothetical protein CCY99_05530 [Helicobacter sp. 16-1353]
MSNPKDNPIFPNMEDFFVQKAKEGIIIKYADIIFGKYFIYILTPQNILYPCVIYNFILSPDEYKKHSKPKIHFCNCRDLWSIFDKDSISLKAKIPQHNLFDFQVGMGKNSSNKLFYNVELPFCPTCISVYETIFLKFNLNPRLELWNLLFASKRIIKLEKIAIEDAFSVNMNFVPMNVHIGDKNFYLTRKENGVDW